MSSGQIVDVDADPSEARRTTRRRMIRVGLPLAGVLLIVVAIVLIILLAEQQNRAGVLRLSDDLISNLDQRIRTEVRGYLEPAAAAATALATFLPAGGLTPRNEVAVERLARGLLQAFPQLATIFIGAPDGAFLMVRRAEQTALQTKLIEIGPAGRRVILKTRAADGRVIAVEEDPEDAYDPRSRPWYQGASADDGVQWTDVYVFFTDRAPGITASRARTDEATGELLAVAGADIRLLALSEFLAGLEIGTTGRALIVDANGDLVAFPDPAMLVEDSDDGLVPRRLGALDDPVLNELYDRIRVAGPGRSVVTVDGERYVLAVSSLAAAVGRDWSLVIMVPEADFVGFVAANSRTALQLSLGVIALAIGLALMLARQGIVADQNARALQRREQAIQAQSAAYEELAATASLFDEGDRDALGRVTETVARAVAARRVSLWRVEADGAGIVCADCYDRESEGHTAGAEILREECPPLFAALASGEEIAVEDAADDPRTAGLAALYLERVGCRALLSVPIANQEGLAGFVWLEDGAATGAGAVEATSFVRTIAHLLGVRFRSASGRIDETRTSLTSEAEPRALAAGAGLAASPLALRTASISRERSRIQLQHLSARGIDDGRLLAAIFPATTVLVLKFSDDFALAASPDGEARMVVVEQIVRTFQEIAERHEVRYVKILNEQIVAAEGFEREAGPAAAAMAEVALELQAACAAHFERLGPTLDYTIGLDTGTVIGSPVGFGKTAYNVWGETVRVAQTMALTARAGTIQASEGTYERLSARFVFRRRGGYYIERVGEMTTYVLRGRL